MRGEAQGVKGAVQVFGMVKLLGNHISGSDEAGSAALLIEAGPWGRMNRNLSCNNIVERCAAVLGEGSQEPWTAGNLFSACGQVPAAKADEVSPEKK